jgi:ribosomal protein S17E
LNRVRKLAEELVSRYPTLFGNDFDKNKEALSQVTIVRTRSLRNQLAGAITKIMHDRAPIASQESESTAPVTMEERVQVEGARGESSGERASQRPQLETKGKESGAVSLSRGSGKPESIQENAAVIR